MPSSRTRVTRAPAASTRARHSASVRGAKRPEEAGGPPAQGEVPGRQRARQPREPEELVVPLEARPAVGRVDVERAAGTEDARHLANGPARVGDVLEGRVAVDDVEARRRERKLLGGGAKDP